MNYFTLRGTVTGALQQKPPLMAVAQKRGGTAAALIPATNQARRGSRTLCAVLAPSAMNAVYFRALESALMHCLRIADGLNTITRRGEIGTSVPVFGLRPIR